MNIKPFKPVAPKVDLITSPKSFFASIKYQYREYRNSGVYNIGAKEGYFIYQIKTEFGTHTGLLCMTSVEDLRKSKILKHEKTLAAKEQQMMHLLMQRKALVKPVLLGYRPIDDLHSSFEKIIKNKKPRIHVVYDNKEEEHLIWTIYDEGMIQKIQKSFNKLKKAYIGDGHHRTTTVSMLNSSKDLGPDSKKYSHLFTAYFPFNQLKICDFNRVVDISEIMTSSRFIAGLSRYFDIKEIEGPQKPKVKHEVTFLIDDFWYSMKWKKKFITKKETSNVILDAALINKYIFEKLLGIVDIRTDTRIKYYGGTEPIEKLIRQTKKFNLGVGLCIYPVSVDELTSIADEHKTLPPKSTFFIPRLRSGIMAKDL